MVNNCYKDLYYNMKELLIIHCMALHFNLYSCNFYTTLLNRATSQHSYPASNKYTEVSTMEDKSAIYIQIT